MYRSQTYIHSNDTAATKTARRFALPCVMVASALLLAACVPTGKTVGLYAGVKQEKKPVHGIAEPAPAQTAAVPKSAPATIWQSADKLMGLAPDALQAALGAPARIRDEETGRIYQYVGSDCVLDLFLYQEAAGGYRVSYAEARTITAEKKPVDLCLKSLPAPVVAENAPST